MEDTRNRELARCEERIRELEETVDALRLSRRILMGLLEQAQQDHAAECQRIMHENTQLRRRLGLAARRLWRHHTAGGEQAKQERDNNDEPYTQ